MMFQFTLRHVLTLMMAICLVATMIHYRSPGLIAVVVDILAVYIVIADTISKRFHLRGRFVRSPRDVFEWITIVIVLVIVNGAAFGSIQRRDN